MDKSLLCKIVVTKTNGRRERGTGYRVARDRIITAAHVVEDADAIALFFGDRNEPYQPQEPPEVCWSGRSHGCGGRDDIDVAVIRCALPDSLVPGGLLLAQGTIRKTNYFGCGFSEKVKSEKESGIYDFDGSFPEVTGHSHQECVDCNNGPKETADVSAGQLWGGVSGSCLFEVESRQLLAVVTDFVPDYELPRLRVAPMPYLLSRRDFRDAIRFDAEQNQRLEYQRLSFSQTLRSPQAWFRMLGRCFLAIAVVCCFRVLVIALSSPSTSEKTVSDVLSCIEHQPADAENKLKSAIEELDLIGKRVRWKGEHTQGDATKGYLEIRLNDWYAATFMLVKSPLASSMQSREKHLTLIGTVSDVAGLKVHLKDARVNGDWTRLRSFFPLCGLAVSLVVWIGCETYLCVRHTAKFGWN